MNASYSTALGAARHCDALDLLASIPDAGVSLCMTSPPFPLLRRKDYGNRPEAAWVDWFMPFAREILRTLRDDGSFVLDLGGAWNPGLPTRGLYAFRLLLRLCDETGFHLAQDMYWHNPARLPSPIEWVNKRKIRVKDSVDTLWWLSRTPWPKADIGRVRVPYGPRMLRLLETGGSAAGLGRRPSGHDLSGGFARDNGGALPGSMLSIPNTSSGDAYQTACRRLGIKAHPARFPAALPAFFVDMLTDPADLVVDPFAGSNTTGFVAESAGRRWLTSEADGEHMRASVLRFVDARACPEMAEASLAALAGGESLDLARQRSGT